MQFDKYLDAQVVNKRGEQGEIILIDENYVTVEYEDDVKTYNTSICFRSFLTFLNDSFNQEIKDYLLSLDRLEEEKKAKVELAYQESIKNAKEIEAEYIKTLQRANVFCAYFGKHYTYKPLTKFKVSRVEVHPYDYWRLYDDKY